MANKRIRNQFRLTMMLLEQKLEQQQVHSEQPGLEQLEPELEQELGQLAPVQELQRLRRVLGWAHWDGQLLLRLGLHFGQHRRRRSLAIAPRLLLARPSSRVGAHVGLYTC
jgi:hypothetical protein